MTPRVLIPQHRFVPTPVTTLPAVERNKSKRETPRGVVFDFVPAVGFRSIEGFLVHPANAYLDVSCFMKTAASLDFLRHCSDVQWHPKNDPWQRQPTGVRCTIGAPETWISLVRLRPRRV